MKDEIIREIARKGALHEGEFGNACAILTMVAPVLERAGYLIAPKEPTAEMGSAGARCLRDTFKAPNQFARATAIYRAMLATLQEGRT